MSDLAVVNRIVCRPRRRPGPTGCCLTPDVPIDRPDPAIYSQKKIISGGGTPSWDSPDILTNFWSPWKLMPETSVTVRNLSSTASAVGVLVELSYSQFGIGMPRQSLSSMSVSLPPLGASTLLFALPQAVINGPQLISVFVRLLHGADADPSNNEGEQTIIHGLTSQVGRTIEFKFPVRNPANFAQSMSLVTYANTLGFTVSPTSHNFAPGEQIMVTGKISVAPGLHSSGDWIQQTATVAAFGTNGAMIGGLTYVVHIDD